MGEKPSSTCIHVFIHVAIHILGINVDCIVRTYVGKNSHWLRDVCDFQFAEIRRAMIIKLLDKVSGIKVPGMPVNMCMPAYSPPPRLDDDVKLQISRHYRCLRCLWWCEGRRSSLVQSFIHTRYVLYYYISSRTISGAVRSQNRCMSAVYADTAPHSHIADAHPHLSARRLWRRDIVVINFGWRATTAGLVFYRLCHPP